MHAGGKHGTASITVSSIGKPTASVSPSPTRAPRTRTCTRTRTRTCTRTRLRAHDTHAHAHKHTTYASASAHPKPPHHAQRQPAFRVRPLAAPTGAACVQPAHVTSARHPRPHEAARARAHLLALVHTVTQTRQTRAPHARHHHHHHHHRHPLVRYTANTRSHSHTLTPSQPPHAQSHAVSYGQARREQTDSDAHSHHHGSPLASHPPPTRLQAEAAAAEAPDSRRRGHEAVAGLHGAGAAARRRAVLGPHRQVPVEADRAA
jgi:hypothetical protein